MQHLVVLTGAGISAESGLKTFRDSGGLWEGHRIEDVASPEGFARNPEMVLDFYNQRRRQLDQASPNDAHALLARLESHFQVTVITQNVDDLHERGGSSNVVHLHGELRYGCSSKNRDIRSFLGANDILYGDLATDGSQLRPDIVWFGEAVPKMDVAIGATLLADIFLVIGTSLEVYPAASLLHFVPHGKPVYIIDPARHTDRHNPHVRVISKKATDGMRELYPILVPDVSTI
jgi:NAD-dependent deacetylase